MRKIALCTATILATIAATPSYAGVYTAWWGWYETQFSSQGACLDGSYKYLNIFNYTSYVVKYW
jgi:hypothetical protein